jgi:hypothetical protein
MIIFQNEIKYLYTFENSYIYSTMNRKMDVFAKI